MNFYSLLVIYFFYICFILCMRVYACMSNICIPRAHRDQKRIILGPMELELMMILCLHVGAENKTQVLCKSNGCLYPLNHVSRLNGPVIFLNIVFKEKHVKFLGVGILFQ